MPNSFCRFFLLILLISSVFHVHAQTTTAQISGLVTDRTGAVIPQATISVVNIDTNISRQVTSNESGNYIVTQLAPGNYKLTVAKAGFSTVVEQHLVLQVNENQAQDISLSAGGDTQTVNVEASSELLQTSSSDLGTVINQQAVHDLPLNGRNFTQLLTLTPGATPISTSQGAAVGTDDGSTVALPGGSTSNPSVNGQQNRSTMYLLDGVVNTDFRTTTYTVLPIIDAIDQFKVVSHNDDPTYGSVLGGIVNLISKSGTNRLHGSAWEFLRNDFFDARDSFADASRTSPQPFRQNEFGGTVGGPIFIPKIYDGRNKTFFFFAYEGWRFRQPAGTIYHSPTAAELNGDFSNSTYLTAAGTPVPIYDPNSTTQTSTGSYGRQQFSYNGTPNVIDPARINTAMQTYLKTYLDAPNLTNNANGNTVLTTTQVNNMDSYHGRLDENITKSDSLFFRWSTMGVNQTVPSNNNINNYTVFNGVNIGGGYTHIFSPKLIADVRGGRASRPFIFTNSSTKGTTGLGGFSSTTGTYGPPAINFDQFYANSSLEGAQLRRNSSASLFTSLTYQLGNHTLTAGGGFVQQFRTQLSSDQSYNFGLTQTGNPTPGSSTSVQANTGNSLASALLGLPSQGTFQSGNGYKDSILSWFAFVGDSWKVSSRLTLNAGLRYDHLDQADLKSGLNNGFNFANGQYYIGGGKLPAACNVSHAAPCIPGSSNDAQTNLNAVLGNDGTVAGSHIVLDPNPIRGPNPVNTNFGPRIGFAYRATDSLVVRGGFGVVFDDLSGVSQTFSNSINNWPSANANPQFNSTFGGSSTTVTQSQANIVGALPSATPFNQGAFLFDPNMKVPYSEQYNLTVDNTIANHYLLSLAYVGAVSRRLDYGGVANNARTPGDLTSIPYPYETHIDWDQSTGSSNYNALQVKFERQLSQGFQFLASYTWSKSIDDTSGRFGSENGSGGSSAIQNFYDPRSNRSVSAYDIPQFFSVTALYELPFGKGKQFLNSGIPSKVLGGWQMNTLAQMRSGQPYTMQMSGDVAQIGDSTDTYARPNYVAGASTTPTKQTKNQWFNTAAFTAPVGTYGNVPRDSMRSSRVNNVDFSVLKNLFDFEGTALQFRAEAFNVFNIINYGVPDSNISDGAAAGTISKTALPARELQFALKLNF